MMKQHFEYFQPLLFGLLTFLLYIILYLPDVKSPDFVTSVLVIFTGMGWSAVIIFSKLQNQFLLFFYIAVSIGFPMLVMLPFGMLNSNQHFVIIGLNALGIILLKLFIGYHIRSERRKKA